MKKTTIRFDEKTWRTIEIIKGIQRGLFGEIRDLGFITIQDHGLNGLNYAIKNIFKNHPDVKKKVEKILK